jgi:hypothetical protein
MKGLVKGEQSSASNPVLQLFARSGGYLADIYAGTFKVESLVDPTAAPTTLVASAPFTVAHKLGTGRYVIPTGATTSWSFGTHRAVCTYTMTNGGPTYVQVIEFELLDPADWPVGSQYVGYLTTRRAYTDGYATLTATTRQTLHRLISEVGHALELWTKRWFDPRYLYLLVDGKDSEILLLQSPIIAIEDVYATWKTAAGTSTYKFEQYLYKVYNRHLRGLLEVDDRKNPKLELVDATDTTVQISGFAWPFGNQNLELRGVFGYTDPELDPSSGDVAIGSTPADIVRACGALVYRRIADPTMSDLMTWSAGAIRSMKTRHQAVTFGGASGSLSGAAGYTGELSGDAYVDAIIAKYRKVFAFGAV